MSLLWAWQDLFKICARDPNEIRFQVNRTRCKLFKSTVAIKCPKLWSEYKKVRNEVTRDLRSAKASHLSRIFGEVIQKLRH